MIVARLLIIAVFAALIVGGLIYLGAVSYANWRRLIAKSSTIIKEANNIKAESIENEKPDGNAV